MLQSRALQDKETCKSKEGAAWSLSSLASWQGGRIKHSKGEALRKKRKTPSELATRQWFTSVCLIHAPSVRSYMRRQNNLQEAETKTDINDVLR